MPIDTSESESSVLAKQHATSGQSTKMAEFMSDELRPGYDESLLRNGVRGKYADRYVAGTNIIRLAPDVAAKFPDDESVNEALRWVIRLAEDAGRITNR
jgi:hypothetical protein